MSFDPRSCVRLFTFQKLKIYLAIIMPILRAKGLDTLEVSS